MNARLTVGEDDAIPPAFLCLIEGAVGASEQVVEGISVVAENRGTDTDSERNRLAGVEWHRCFGKCDT